MLHPSSVDTVIYHSPCMDGYGAAYAAWKRLGNQAVFIPHRIGARLRVGDFVEKNIAIVDLSFDVDVINSLLANGNKLVVVDHHLTAKNKLVGVLPDHLLYRGVDMSHSGAVLSWMYFNEFQDNFEVPPDIKSELKPSKKHPSEITKVDNSDSLLPTKNTNYTLDDVPIVLRYIEDHDLWKFEMPNSRAISYALQNLDQQNFAELDKVVQGGMDAIHVLTLKGQAMQEMVTQMLRNLLPRATLCTLKKTKHVCWVINTPLLINEIGEALAQWLSDEGDEVLPLPSSSFAHAPQEFTSQPKDEGSVDKINLNLGSLSLQPNDHSSGDEMDFDLDNIFAFVYSYHHQGNQFSISLRAVNDSVDLSKIAEQYGGGGHRRAAGFRYEGESIFDIISPFPYFNFLKLSASKKM